MTPSSRDRAPRPPAPRRIRVGPTGWMLLRDLAVADPAVVRADRLPTMPRRDEDVGAAHAALRSHGVVDRAGDLVAPVLAGLRLLAAAPVVVGLARSTDVVDVEAVWATVGVPTAGVVVTRRRAPDGTADLEVELQVLVIDDLVSEVVAVLGVPLGDQDTTVAAGRIDLLDAAIAGALPAPLDEVVVDGRPALHARLQVAGPRGARVATVVGDGRHAWQLGARDRETLAWRHVTASGIAAALGASVTAQLQAVGAGHG